MLDELVGTADLMKLFTRAKNFSEAMLSSDEKKLRNLNYDRYE